MKTTITFISAITKKSFFTSIFIFEINIIKLAKRRYLRVRNIIAYAIKIIILQSKKN